jgi:hypothetical protein
MALAGPILIPDEEGRETIDDDKSARKADSDYSDRIQREKAAAENVE